MIEIIYENGPGGNCPVQAEGFIDGLPFYFRSRGSGWSLSIAKNTDIDPLDYKECFYHQELYKGKNYRIEDGKNDRYIYSAGWAEPDECKEFIERTAKILLNKQ